MIRLLRTYHDTALEQQPVAVLVALLPRSPPAFAFNEHFLFLRPPNRAQAAHKNHYMGLTPADVRRNDIVDRTVVVYRGKRPVGDRDTGHQHSQ